MGGRLPARTNLILPLSHRPAALEAVGCVRVFTDIRQEREELWKCLDYLRPGDSLDRLGRPIQDLISIVAGLRKRGIGFQSCTSPSTPPRPAATLSSTCAPRSQSSSAN
ncbi:recombinase family protein [Streptomyces sp. NPDC055006]